MQRHYIITVVGHLDHSWSDWFDSLAIENQGNGQAVLAGPLPDQSSLHGVLGKIRDLGLPLLSLYSMEPEGAPGQLRLVERLP
jgi:hypothetical protein